MKKIILIVLCLISIWGYSQDEFYRVVDWKFYPNNVIQLTDSTYLTDASPFDYNDPGAIQRIVGSYVVDYVGHRFAVIDSTSTTITVLDIYHTGQAPQTGQVARCYRSVDNGEAEYIGSVDYSPLDESARWKLNGSDNELLWRHGIDYWLPFKRLVVDTTYLPDNSERTGTSYWDAFNHTYSDVLENGVTGQRYEELFIAGQNDTGGTLENGKVATYASSIGNSGNMRIEFTVASESEPSFMTLGIITHDMLNGERGKVTTFGKVRGIQTNGANYGETWGDKDILYKSATYAGGLTKFPPGAPIPAIPIAVVISAHATNGTLFVRPTYPTSLQMLTDVNGTPLTISGQLPVWNQDSLYFDFTENINNYKRASYCASTMTVNSGTLNAGTVSDLCAVGGTDVDIQELSGADPLRVTFAFTGVQRMSSFVFYGDYNGGASHQVWVEIYNPNTTNWDFLGQFSSITTKQWYSFNIFTPNSYISSGNAQVRLSHQGSGVSSHELILDYVDVNFGGAGGGTTIGASSVYFTPAGNISSTNVESALIELDSEKVPKVASTDNAVARFDGTGGLLQNSTVLVTDAGSVQATTAVLTNLSSSGTSVVTASATGELTKVSGASSQYIAADGTVKDFPEYANTPQALTGTNPTWDLSTSRDKTITLTGNTTITLTNAVAGMTGTLWVTNAATTYTITFAGYANAIDPFIRLAPNMVITSGGGKPDDYTFKYNGTKMNWNGTLNRQ